MSLCINPSCSNPQNLDTLLFCQACGSELLLAGHYRVMRLLSNKGGFGTTYEVSHKGQPKVLKVLINYQGKAVELFEQEARVLQQLNHPGIPKGESYFTFCPRNSQMPLHCLVMEKIEGLDLQEYLKKRGNRPIDQTLALEWLMQLAEILDEVHGQNFFHRDIKPSNIILRADGQLVLIDFGTVREITATYKLKQAAGGVTGIISLGYTPSEQLHHHAVPQSDFFSLGRTFVYLLTGKEPTDPDIYDCQNDELVWRSRASNISSELADFIDRLMMRSATHRPRNTGEILKRLAEIDRIVNPPPPPRRVPSQVSATVPIAPVNPVTPTSSPGTAGLLNRRRLLHMAGFGGVGVMVVGIIHQLQRHPFPWINNPAIKSTAPGQLTLSSFEFEVVTVDQKGKIATRNRRVAQYFTEELGNGVTLEMVAIPGGTFKMGSPTTEKERSDSEGPQHSRTIAPFYMGKFTVTQAQWRAVAALPKVSRELNPDPSYFKGDNLPVENISWHEAVEFCDRISKRSGRKYRLPSEAEWEYACRAGTTTPFHFGETITPELANYDGNNSYGQGTKGVYREKTTPVGSFQVANAFGLYDMHGNVWEWCADSWHENYQGAPSDGRAWVDNDYILDMLRGGSWNNYPRLCRSAYRSYYLGPSATGYIDGGFRVGCAAARTS